MTERDGPQPGFPGIGPEHLIGKRTVVGAAAGAVLLLAGVQAADYLDRSGGAIVIPPQSEQPVTDTEYRIGSWNMHNETAVRLSDLRKFARQEDLDVMMLQEVNRSDVQALKRTFPNWGIAYVLADTKQELVWGGFGNAILTRGQKPKDVETRSFAGKSVKDAISDSVMGAVVDLVNGDTSFARSREGLEENRAIVAVTSQSFDGKNHPDVRLMTTHIAARKGVHQDQLEQAIDFAKDNTKDDRPTIVCGDMNGNKRDIIPKFAKIGFITPETGRTSATGAQTLDYCTYYEAGKFGVGAMKTVSKFKTDHNSVVISFDVRPKPKY